MSTYNKLLVEGKDDLHVVCNLMKYESVPDVFKIKPIYGIEKLLETMDVEFIESGLLRMGIMIDADVDLDSRWQALRQRIQDLGFQNIPDNLDVNGTILRQEGMPSIGLWIMPDNRLNGMLEDFIAALIPEGDPCWPRVQECVDHIPINDRRFSDERMMKAKIHTWLAWQEEPGKPLGQAITAHYLNPNAVEAKLFVDWIRRLFEIA